MGNKLIRDLRAVAGLTLAVAIALLGPACSKSTDVDDEETDTTPPTTVTNLVVLGATSETVTLQWQTPQDRRDDSTGGPIVAYDLRISSDSLTAQNFAAAQQIAEVPDPLGEGQVQVWVVRGCEPDGHYYFALKAEDDHGNWSAVSNCVSAHCAALQKVEFADTVLERIVREHLGKPNGDLLSSDVDTITELSAPHAGIADLSGLNRCISLHMLNLPGNNVVSLAPLADLEQLADLYMNGNQISDLGPLAGMKRLHQVQVGDNPVTDISPLAAVDSLQQLILWRTDVTDFSPLYGLYFLSEVGFDEMDLADISFMAHLKRPQRVGLAFNHITNADSLRSLYMVESLNLMQNQITTIAGLGWMTGLRELRLTNNQISDIMPLVNNPGIDSGDVVYLEGNPLSQTAIDIQVWTLRNRGVTVVYP